MPSTKDLYTQVDNQIVVALSNLHTATIARVTAVNEKTIDVQPVINRVIDGESIELPQFVEVPPVFLNGGASYLAHPISVGDYALIIITERCFDRWYDGFDESRPPSQRMHNYSDGLAIVGLRNFQEAITIPQETTMTGTTRMGTENPSDRMALASLVITEFNRVKTDLENLKAAFDAHAHGGVATGNGSTAPPATPFPAPTDPGEVKSEYVKAD